MEEKILLFNTESWIQQLATHSDGESLLRDFLPLGIKLVLKQVKDTDIVFLCRQTLQALAAEYKQLLEKGILPGKSTLQLEGPSHSATWLSRRMEQIIQATPLPWLFAWKAKGKAAFDMQYLCASRVALDTECSKCLFELFTPTKRFEGKRRLLQQRILSVCAMVIRHPQKDEELWLSWDRVVDGWMRRPQGAPSEATKVHIQAVCKLLGSTDSGEDVVFEALADQTTPFKTYLLHYSISKILKENLQVSCSDEIKRRLFDFFSNDDVARKFALYYTLQLTLGRPPPLRIPLDASSQLDQLLDASDMLREVEEEFRGAFFELVFTSSKKGREFLRKFWNAAVDTPIVYHKFKQAYDVILGLKDLLQYPQEEMLYLVSRTARFDEPSECSDVVRTFPPTNPLQSFYTFLDTCELALGSTFHFSETYLRERHPEIAPLFGPLSKEELVFLLAFMQARQIPPASSTSEPEGIQKYHFSPFQKALLCSECAASVESREVLTFEERRELVAGFETLFGHDLPQRIAFSCLLSHTIPKTLREYPLHYMRLKGDIQEGMKRLPCISSRHIQEMTELEVALITQCRLTDFPFRDVEEQFGVFLVQFAKHALARTKVEDTRYGVQPFFPLTLPHEAEELERQNREFYLISEYPSHSLGFKYTWEEVTGGFCFHLEILRKHTHKIDVTLAIARKDIKVGAETLHWIIRLISHENSWIDVKEISEREHLEKVLKGLEEHGTTLPLHLPWSEEMWGHVILAYRFAKELRHKVLTSLINLH